MGETARRIANPFLDPPAPTPPTFHDPLHPLERITLAQAPRRGPVEGGRSDAPACPPALGRRRPGQPGTEVTVRAYPVPVFGKQADHMYVSYDDGHDTLIARGGPSERDLGSMEGAILADNLTVESVVGPEKDSLDRGRGGRVMFRGYLPGVSATLAAAPAVRHAAGVNRGGNDYHHDSTSNSFAADVIEPLFGCRVGDSRTWGYRTRLREAPPTPPRRDSRGIPRLTTHLIPGRPD